MGYRGISINFIFKSLEQYLAGFNHEAMIRVCVPYGEKIVTKDGKVGGLKKYAGKQVIIVVTKGQDK